MQENYAYSETLLSVDLIWTPETLNEWLIRPRDFLKGTKMTFVGIPRADDRLALLAYIKVVGESEE
jgi:cytochrome c